MMASPETVSTVKPGFWCWSFHEFFAYKFGGNKLMQGRTLTPQQVLEMQKDFDLSAGRLSRCIPAGICHSGCRFGRMECALTVMDTLYSKLYYCTAHEGWDVTGYQGRLPWGVQLVKTGGRRVFVVKIRPG